MPTEANLCQANQHDVWTGLRLRSNRLLEIMFQVCVFINKQMFGRAIKGNLWLWLVFKQFEDSEDWRIVNHWMVVGEYPVK